MFNKLFALTVLTAATCVAANAQNAPGLPTDRRVQRMVFGVPFEGSYLGVQTENISKENFSKYGLAAVRGVGIDSIVKDSPAAKAGLQKGDVIVEIDGKEAKTMMDLIRALNEKSEGGVAVTFIRDRNRQTVNVTPETVKQEKMKPEEFNNFFKVDGQDSSDN